jgi:hypothetical protein
MACASCRAQSGLNTTLRELGSEVDLFCRCWALGGHRKCERSIVRTESSMMWRAKCRRRAMKNCIGRHGEDGCSILSSILSGSLRHKFFLSTLGSSAHQSNYFSSVLGGLSSAIHWGFANIATTLSVVQRRGVWQLNVWLTKHRE